MPQIIDLLGQRFGRLTVISFAGKNKHNHATWLCRCDCGEERVVESGNLRTGRQISCGCQGLENRISATIKHHLSAHPLHGIWAKIKERCYNPQCASYPNYGGKGVTMCDEWKNDFKSFYDWAIKNGWRKGLQVDKDIKALQLGLKTGKIYSPQMCSVVTRKENQNATSKNIYLTIDGITRTISQWAETVELGAQIIAQRVRKGLPPKECVYGAPRITKRNRHLYKQ